MIANKMSTRPESNHDIRIKLFEPVVIFRGNVNESVGSLLRGEITLKLKKPIKITRIELKFSGKSKTSRPNAFGTTDKHNKLEIISKKINFLSHSNFSPIKLFSKSLFLSRNKKKDFTTFSSGIHTFPFEIHLPGSLPESIMTEFGSVQYKLKFKINHVSTFRSKTFQSVRKVEIVRIIPDYINSNGIEVSRNYNRIIDYQVSIPKKSFSLGESIPIDFKIMPLIKKFKLHSIETTLVQKITCNYIKNENKVECIRYSDNNRLQFDENEEENGMGNLDYEKTLKFDLSKCNNLILHHSVETPLIKIKHELRFGLLLSAPNDGRKKRFNGRIKSKLCFNVGINLSSCSVKRNVDALPSYDDISFYCSCHPKYQRIARLVLGDFHREDGGRCINLSCNFADNKPPRYSE